MIWRSKRLDDLERRLSDLESAYPKIKADLSKVRSELGFEHPYRTKYACIESLVTVADRLDRLVNSLGLKYVPESKNPPHYEKVKKVKNG